MAEPDKDLSTRAGHYIRAGSPAMIIPTLLVVGPLLGFFAGSWIGGKLGGHDVAGGLIGLIFGLIASFREIAKIVRKMIHEQEMEDLRAKRAKAAKDSENRQDDEWKA